MTATDTELESAVSAESNDGETLLNDGDFVPIQPEETSTARRRRQVSVSLRTVIVAVVMCLLAGAAGALGWLYLGAQDQLSAQAREASNRSHAEDVAATYAVNAADMDYQDFTAWKGKLVSGTSPDLTRKLTDAAGSMEQVLAPLQWKSTAKPLATKVRSVAGGIYTVDSFVSVLTKTVQAPDGLQSTATYSITIDGNDNWQITDVGGIDSALGK